MLAIRKQTHRGGNLLAAALCQQEDPSRARLLSLEASMAKSNSTWEIHNPNSPSVLDVDEAARAVVDGTCYVSSKPIGFAEVYQAGRIRRMMELQSPSIPLVKGGLTDSQAHAAQLVLDNHVSILTGGPGTGKTYTLLSIAESLDKAGLRVGYCSPTGTAAKRMSLSTGRPALTTHRMLGFKPRRGFTVNEDNPLPYDVIVMDEGTIVDGALFNALLRALGDARLIMVGDHNQLPPVSPGRPFHSLVDIVPTARLTEVKRTDPDGPIGQACLSIIRGEMPEQASKGETGFFMIPRPANSLVDYLLHCAIRMSPQVHNVGILSPFNNTCDKINQYFLEHSRMNGIGPYPVMCIKNDYDENIFNGEVGLSNVYPCQYYRFEGRLIEYQPWRDVLAFARTIHKSQGGEWDDVLIHNPKNDFVTRNLVYTAVSRGKRRVAVVGCIESFGQSLTAERCDRRVSLLGELVTGQAKLIQ